MRVSFPHPIQIEYLDARRWILTRPFVALIEEKHAYDVTIPSGFVTDFASVPRIFWNIFPPEDSWTEPAALHDFLYFRKGQIEDRTLPPHSDLSRAECDRIFLEGMKSMGVSAVRRKIMYYSVRAFGPRF